MGLRPLEMFGSEVYRHQILTTKVDPRTVRIISEALQSLNVGGDGAAQDVQTFSWADLRA